MRPLERLLLKKVELWMLLLAGLCAVVGSTLLASLVRHQLLGGAGAGALGEISLKIASFPSLAKQVLLEPERNEHRAEARFELSGGFHHVPGGPQFPVDQRVLINRYDGDIGYNVTELRSPDGSPSRLRWVFDEPEKFAYDRRSPKLQDLPTADPATMRATHALLDARAHLTFHFGVTALYQLDRQGQLIWRNQDFGFHHALEPDGEGGFWVPGRHLQPERLRGASAEYLDDCLVQISGEGETLYWRSVTEILIDNGLANRIYTYDKYITDPIHLNDIEPVLVDGPHWRRGDVFASLGHLNMVLLYRPSEDKLLWWSQETMRHQHDVDILSDHSISIFNNHRLTDARGQVVEGHNELLTFTWPSQATQTPWSAVFKALDIRTVSQGLVDGAHGSWLLVEETDAGRLLMLSPAGELAWQYINKDSQGRTWTLNWSRLVSAELARAVVGPASPEE